MHRFVGSNVLARRARDPIETRLETDRPLKTPLSVSLLAALRASRFAHLPENSPSEA